MKTSFVGALLAAPLISLPTAVARAQQAAPLQRSKPIFCRGARRAPFTDRGKELRTEDGYIIHKCLNGDSAAFGFLVDKYKASIYAFAYSRLLNFHDAEDVTQEVFIKAYQKLRTLRRSDSFLAWLYSITSNLCKMLIRSRFNRPDREFVEDQEPQSLDNNSISSYRDKQIRESLHEALASLPEMYREVLSLYYLGGLSSKEIARFLGTSPNTINQRLMRARLKLKEEMLAMMSETFDQVKLQPSFTFRIIEMVKRMRIESVPPHAPWLPWGLSLLTGAFLTLLGFTVLCRGGFQTRPYIPNVELTSSDMPNGVRVLEIGEVPVEVVKVSEVPIMSNGNGNFNGRGVQLNAPTLRGALAFLFAPQGGEGKWTKKADMPTARAQLSTSIVNGKIYAIGGRGRGSIVEEYDLGFAGEGEEGQGVEAKGKHATTWGKMKK